MVISEGFATGFQSFPRPSFSTRLRFLLRIRKKNRAGKEMNGRKGEESMEIERGGAERRREEKRDEWEKRRREE